jgi:hypothetical protein
MEQTKSVLPDLIKGLPDGYVLGMDRLLNRKRYRLPSLSRRL